MWQLYVDPVLTSPLAIRRSHSTLCDAVVEGKVLKAHYFKLDRGLCSSGPATNKKLLICSQFGELFGSPSCFRTACFGKQRLRCFQRFVSVLASSLTSKRQWLHYSRGFICYVQSFVCQTESCCALMWRE